MAKRGLPPEMERPWKGATATRASTTTTPSGVGQHRIELEFAQFGDVGGKLRYLHQQQGDGVDIGGGNVAIVAQRADDARLFDQAARQRQIERRQGQRLVVDDLDRLAAAPEDDHRAKGRIVGDAQHQFARIGPPHHGMDGDAVDPRLGRLDRDPIQHLARRVDHLFDRAQVEHDAAEIGFVDDVARHDFHDAAAVAAEHQPRDFRRFFRRARQPGGGDRNVIGFEQGADFDRRQPGVAARDRLLDNGAGLGGIRREIDRQGGRRRHQGLARLSPFDHVHEARHGAALIMRDARAFENMVRILVRAVPDRKNRLGD